MGRNVWRPGWFFRHEISISDLFCYTRIMEKFHLSRIHALAHALEVAQYATTWQLASKQIGLPFEGWLLDCCVITFSLISSCKQRNMANWSDQEIETAIKAMFIKLESRAVKKFVIAKVPLLWFSAACIRLFAQRSNTEVCCCCRKCLKALMLHHPYLVSLLFAILPSL